ncbi:hypothetical protein EG328_004993 [Venturia inaequalis]|uniref:Uncharacterized protein n=1 Tax=Venturia inaequalis TaxID=5025 RepID=A0A8H3ZBV7_VENIN|nr:hypothetical protein EG328_004993 [Venturia inaequalis]RDI89038.1 hypothetical protein Vi05172_g1623 [Venturia inaequalis]
MPNLSNHQDSEADNQNSTYLTFYHHSNESTTTLVRRPLSYGSIESRVTFFDSDSDSPASLSRRASSPSSLQGPAHRPKPLWDCRWPFPDNDTPAHGDSELGYLETDTLGPTGVHRHELNDISLSTDRPLARLESFANRDQWAQWIQRCQTFSEISVIKEVKRGKGIIVAPEFVKEAQSAKLVGFADSEAQERPGIFNSNVSKFSAAAGTWSSVFSKNGPLPREAGC